MSNNLSLNLWWGKQPPGKRKIYPNVIIDRRSKYTVVSGYVKSKEDVDNFIKEILKDKYFRKATHNSYAYRIELESWSILESKNDDGESGAWNCILRELQRSNAINAIVVVTRYFGGIHLQADRFKNVIKGAQIALDEFI